ncbi:hypothetical protein F2P81_012321 [Scophthalmus maximus]|uniref:Uncharacterized protein n=1 Tax=Scophthalmus maximus TaxID=52904 RepID=A0A6A4SK81_SCOMX|nr:hypothetical protein F2P81_012321 [Scophthalmus maximus]
MVVRSKGGSVVTCLCPRSQLTCKGDTERHDRLNLRIQHMVTLSQPIFVLSPDVTYTLRRETRKYPSGLWAQRKSSSQVELSDIQGFREPNNINHYLQTRSFFFYASFHHVHLNNFQHLWSRLCGNLLSTKTIIPDGVSIIGG